MWSTPARCWYCCCGRVCACVRRGRRPERARAAAFKLHGGRPPPTTGPPQVGDLLELEGALWRVKQIDLM